MRQPTYSQIIEPDERLNAVFRHVYGVQHAPDAPALPQQLMPNYEMLLAFNFGPSMPTEVGDQTGLIRQTAVLGPLQKILRYELPPGADLMVVVFTLNGFYRLLGKTLDSQSFTDLRADSPSLATLWQSLADIPSLTDRFARFCTYALDHLAPEDATTRIMPAGVAYFEQTVIDPVKGLAEVQQVSPRSIQLRFQSHLGYSAKELSRFLRFKKILNYLVERTPASVDWMGLATQFGYYDQSHLNRDFRYFLGQTPRQFLQQLATGEVCVSRAGKFY